MSKEFFHYSIKNDDKVIIGSFKLADVFQSFKHEDRMVVLFYKTNTTPKAMWIPVIKNKHANAPEQELQVRQVEEHLSVEITDSSDVARFLEIIGYENSI